MRWHWCLYFCVCVLQMHPLGLCNNNDEEDLYEYGWVGVVKLEQPELDPSCLTVLGKVSVYMHITFSTFFLCVCDFLNYISSTTGSRTLCIFLVATATKKTLQNCTFLLSRVWKLLGWKVPWKYKHFFFCTILAAIFSAWCHCDWQGRVSKPRPPRDHGQFCVLRLPATWDCDIVRTLRGQTLFYVAPLGLVLRSSCRTCLLLRTRPCGRGARGLDQTCVWFPTLYDVLFCINTDRWCRR